MRISKTASEIWKNVASREWETIHHENATVIWGVYGEKVWWCEKSSGTMMCLYTVTCLCRGTVLHRSLRFLPSWQPSIDCLLFCTRFQSIWTATSLGNGDSISLQRKGQAYLLSSKTEIILHAKKRADMSSVHLRRFRVPRVGALLLQCH